MQRAKRVSAGVVAVVAVLVGSLVLAGGGSGAEPGSSAGAGPGGDPLELLPLQTTADRRIVDVQGREVLLRGANVNSYGEYWQGVADAPPTVPVTGADWDAMAARGFTVVRLLVTWSRIEPERGVIDHGYLDSVDAAVRAAAARGIYTVIDMHQDAYTAFITTSDPSTCPPGTGPAKGWDGAPAWAVITDGLSTCTPGERNASPAVNRAWNHFYDNTDGIRDELADVWGVVAERFKGRPEVAGFDLLNEPEVPRPAAEITPLYEAYLADSIRNIRAAEADQDFDHLIFIEPALPAGNPAYGLVIPNPDRAGVDRANIVASVHNYAESIGGLGLTIEGMNDLIETITAGMGVPNWGGEYGFWDTAPSTLAKARRYAADEDRRRWGGAWWQWRQACGDPHGVEWRDGQVVIPGHDSVHLNRLGCPGDVDLGQTDEFLDILGRGFPRATPGRLVSLSSDPATGLLDVNATAGADDVGRSVVVWTPTADDAGHRVDTVGLTQVVERPVAGGRIITGVVAAAGDYVVRVGPRAGEEPGSTSTSSTSSTMPSSSVPGGSSTSVPETTVPETTVPNTTWPDTTVPDTTVPDSTIPDDSTTTTVYVDCLCLTVPYAPPAPYVYGSSHYTG